MHEQQLPDCHNTVPTADTWHLRVAARQHLICTKTVLWSSDYILLSTRQLPTRSCSSCHFSYVNKMLHEWHHELGSLLLSQFQFVFRSSIAVLFVSVCGELTVERCQRHIRRLELLLTSHHLYQDQVMGFPLAVLKSISRI